MRRANRLLNPVNGFAALIILAALAIELPRWDATFAADRVYFLDPDDYTRMLRVRDLLAGDTRRIDHMPLLSAPEGVRLHWTAPMDYLLAIPIRLVAGFVGSPDPPAAVAAIVPPLLGVAYLICMMRMMRRGFGAAAALLAGLFVAMSPAFHRAFALGHPDHHCLLALLLLIGVGCWLPPRCFDGLGGLPVRRAVALGGAAIGLAIWVSVESLVVWGVTYGGVWLAERRSDAAVAPLLRAARARWSGAVLIVVLIGCVLERAPARLMLQADQISLLHVLPALAAWFAANARRVRADSPATTVAWKRCLSDWGYCGAALLLGLLVVLVVRDAAGVLGPMSDPRYVRWTQRLMEFQPLIRRAGGEWALQPMLLHLGYAGFALPIALWAFVRSPVTAGTARAVFSLLAVVLLAVSILQLRWADHLILALAPVLVGGLLELLRPVRLVRQRATRRLRAGIGLAALCLLCAPSAGALLARTSQAELSAMRIQMRAAAAADEIRRHHAAEHGDAGAAARRPTVAILCEEGDGPLLAYWTGLPVVAAPYHRAIAGIADAATLFASRDDLKITRLLAERRIGYIVVPARLGEQLINFELVCFGALRSVRIVSRIDEQGRYREKLEYLPGYEQTLAYRLFIDQGLSPLGIRVIQKIREGAATADGLSGFVYTCTR